MLYKLIVDEKIQALIEWNGNALLRKHLVNKVSLNNLLLQHLVLNEKYQCW
jgi:hypothetical protein